ncbi:sigma-54-dependent Fis family transcriptional regulator, partial [Candidatus Dependentiae bacterium]|nr:sigma-54-dependent Fis family transcriptional regulator [Candidatus Dependentiae bacterium]
IENAVKAIKIGAFDFISKPFQLDKIRISIENALERSNLKKENSFLKKQIKDKFGFEGIIGLDYKMIQIFKTILKIRNIKSNVLILGESGTGKELIAKAIHTNSIFKDKPFVTINCSTIPKALFESELFGHKKGSFTDAVADKKGLFEESDNGILFLDEIAEIPFEVQSKLLRAIQNGEIRAVGSNKIKKVNVRILSATNKNIKKLIEEQKFREDLYFRINIIELTLPSLKDRKEDIPILINHFINKYNEILNKKIKYVANQAMNFLILYDWPGNIRELENFIERAIVMDIDNIIDVDDLPKTFKEFTKVDVFHDIENTIIKTLKQTEKETITRALLQTNGNKSQAALILGTNRKRLARLVKKHSIDMGQFDSSTHFDPS